MEYTSGYFHSNVERIMKATNLNEIYNIMTEKCLGIISKFQNKGSGCQFDKVESFDIHVDPFKPLGGSYFPLPEKLAAKKAIINVRNEHDNECFKWAVTSVVYPRKNNPQRLNDEMRKNSGKFDWTGIDFPTSLEQIKRFEEQNPYSINVYEWDGENVDIISDSEHKNERHINLLLLENDGNRHYCWIKNMSALTTSQVSKHKGKRHICDYCSNLLTSEHEIITEASRELFER